MQGGVMGSAHSGIRLLLCPVDLSRCLLPGSVLLLALTQVPSACQSMAVLNCQRRFLDIAKTEEPIRESIAVQFCNGTSSGREAF